MKSLHVTVLLAFTMFQSYAQQTAYDFGKLFREKKLTTYNRHASIGDGSTLKMDAAENNGVVWLNDATFSFGTINIELKGKDALQRSFLGVAFHGANDSTYDVIYFRPFNFRSTDPVRKIHAVQYISLPTYDWKKLRDERNGVYEKGLISPPDPNGWFRARIVVSKVSVQVFVNDDKDPSLTVDILSDRTDGKVGVWVGNGSDGEFRNLVITRLK